MDHDAELSKRKFLIHIVQLECVNHETIARAFHESVKLLGEDFNKNQILSFLSDAAPYMVKYAKAIKIFYPKIFACNLLSPRITPSGGGGAQ